MSGPLSTLLELNAITVACDEVQTWINLARTTFPTDQLFQLQLDRQQSEIDDKRQFVEQLKHDISMRN